MPEVVVTLKCKEENSLKRVIDMDAIEAKYKEDEEKYFPYLHKISFFKNENNQLNLQFLKVNIFHKSILPFNANTIKARNILT